MAINWREIMLEISSPVGLSRDLPPENRVEARDSGIGIAIQGFVDRGLNGAIQRGLERLESESNNIIGNHTSGGVVAVALFSSWTEWYTGMTHYRFHCCNLVAPQWWQNPRNGVENYNNTPQLEPRWGDNTSTILQRKFFWGSRQ